MPSAPAHLVDPSAVEAIDVLGPTVHFLTSPDAGDDAPLVMRGTIPPGAVVPLHSHADPETFLALSGELEGLSDRGPGFTWIPIRPGDVFHVPGGAKHGFRNRSQEPAVSIITTTTRIGRFFREVGAPLGQGPTDWPPPDDVIRHFLDTAARYGYWNATPAENAAVGLAPPAAA